MGKYGADAGASLTENLPHVAEGFGTYWLGGIIAFDQNRQNPELRYGWDLGKFAKRIANRFGALIPSATAILNTQKSLPPRSPTSTPLSCLTTWIMAACAESSG